MDRAPASLLRQGVYSLAWVKDFYDRTSAWWGPNTDHAAYAARASEVERLAGPGRKRILDLGSDADPRRLLGRIAGEWLAPGGCVLMDVYNPSRPARAAGREAHPEALPGVPGSVAMIERCHFDPVHSRWTDGWVPVADPSAALAQTLRCYAPADLLLLLEGTGFALERLEVDGSEVALDDRIADAGPLLDAWQYMVKLRAAGPPA